MKVFLSSTYEDLIEYRLKAANAIERLGQQGVRMEVFGARPAQATEACFNEIESSDAVIGIYAHRYGYIPDGSEVSITEQEFDFAQAKHKATFCFLVDEDFPWSPRFFEHEPGLSKLRAFKDKISSTVVRDVFATPDDLAYKVSAALCKKTLVLRYHGCSSIFGEKEPIFGLKYWFKKSKFNCYPAE
jgi:hypothetical protein